VLSTRSKGKDTYYLPGGKRESGESDLDTLEREIDEIVWLTSADSDRVSPVDRIIFAHLAASGLMS